MTNFITLPNGAIINCSKIISVLPGNCAITVYITESTSTTYSLPNENIPGELDRIQKAINQSPPVKIGLNLDQKVVGDAIFKAVRETLSDALDTQSYTHYNHFGGKLITKIGESVKASVSEALRIREFTTLDRTVTLGMVLAQKFNESLWAKNK